MERQHSYFGVTHCENLQVQIAVFSKWSMQREWKLVERVISRWGFLRQDQATSFLRGQGSAVSLVGFLKIKNGGLKCKQIWNDCPLCPAAGSRWADKCRNGKFPNEWGFPWVKNVVVFSFEKAFWRYSTTTQARALGSISHADKYFKKMV